MKYKVMHQTFCTIPEILGNCSLPVFLELRVGYIIAATYRDTLGPGAPCGGVTLVDDQGFRRLVFVGTGTQPRPVILYVEIFCDRLDDADLLVAAVKWYQWLCGSSG